VFMFERVRGMVIASHCRASFGAVVVETLWVFLSVLPFDWSSTVANEDVGVIRP
jgi:hypothetical protein